MLGKVAKFWPDKGWGFIRPDAGGVDVWFHVADLEAGVKADLAENVSVTYDVGPGQGNRTKAVHVRVCQTPAGAYSQPDPYAGEDAGEDAGDWRDEVRAMAQRHLAAFMADLESYLGQEPV